MRAIILVLFLSMCACHSKDEAGQALDDARRLAAQGDYEGALAKHVWFHDNALKIRRSYYGVRLSFALSYWVELGEQYPKALEKLKSIRDEKTTRIRGGETNRELFHDVAAINDHLAESKATVELFKALDASQPKFAAEVFDVADESLLKNKEYALARKHLGDPQNRLDAARRNFESGMDYAKTSKSGDASRKAFERIFTDDVVRLVTLLKETGDEPAAKKIQADALKTLNNATIRDALKE